MKKLLLGILIVLFSVMAYFVLSSELNIFGLKVLGVQQISEANDKLNQEIDSANKLINTDYPQKVTSLKQEAKKLATAKQSYVDSVNLSSPEEIIEATRTEFYSVEYLWTKIGKYADEEGVDVVFQLAQSSLGNDIYDLNFTVNGPYISIINFIYAIEDDTELSYRIQSFKIAPNGTSLAATFTVSGVYIDTSSLSTGGDTSGSTSGTAGSTASGSASSGIISRSSDDASTGTATSTSSSTTTSTGAKASTDSSTANDQTVSKGSTQVN